MLEICRKKQLAKNMKRMQAAAPGHYDFVPKTYILPAEMEPFLDEFRSKARRRAERSTLRALTADAAVVARRHVWAEKIPEPRALRSPLLLTESNTVCIGSHILSFPADRPTRPSFRNGGRSF